ncbi:hypothetical protein C2845_PM05G28410 [Panicum miliaceum]|uniref:At1g61320/AtMIF1 LRR domain-containing protein n=1 Tax=Panicum miliaceum TaxID=4540 RepID=A0A3L6SYI9_PANMI|nr:hypothetical protein C2845_PM05G28410 [Panicum miliaceum]
MVPVVGTGESTSVKMSHLEHCNFPILKAKGLKSAKYITKRRRSQSNSRRIRQRQLDFLSIIPCKVNVQSLPEEAAQMSVLSSVWRQACVFHPNLYFGIETFLGSHAKGGVCSDPSKRMPAINKFIERVDAILKNHCGTQVNKFAVNFGLSIEHANHINRWVLFGIASKARVISLNLSPNRSIFSCDHYDFPFQLFNGQNASYLQVLQLDSVTLGSPPDFCGFANLKMLDLYNVILLQDLQHFLSKCCVLEWLSIRSCFEMSHLCVPEPLCHLQYLCLQDCDFHNIEFHAPNLTTFEYTGAPVLMNLNECLKLKTATIALSLNKTLKYVLIGIPSILPHVETMHVELEITTEMSGFIQYPPKFIRLKHLTMETTCWGDPRSVFQLAYLLEAAPLLEDLHLEMFGLNPICCPIDLQDVMDLPHYHLKTVCIKGFCGNSGQVELAKYILKNALILEHLIVKPGRKYKVSTLSTIFEHWRKEAKEELAPLARDGVLTIV